MRTVKFSKTFAAQLLDLIDYGERQFGQNVADEKRRRVLSFITNRLALNPRMKARHATLGLVVYPIRKTPFTVLYDYDAHELRVLFIFHGHADLDAVDPSTVEW